MQPLSLVLLVLILVKLIPYVFTNDIWLDESGQYWMSLGLNHLSSIDSPISSLDNVHRNNINWNMDPGGFTYLLRFWIIVFGHSIVSLRSLPFVFLLFSLFVCTKISTFFTYRSHLSAFLPLILLSSGIIFFYGFEIRAYSAELFFWLCYLLSSLYLTQVSILSFPSRHLIAIGLLFSPLTFRYSLVIPCLHFTSLFF